jgi:hypothetical protein
VWFNNFGGAYLRGGFVPDGGADFGIASFPLQPDSLDHIIRADIAPDPIISLTEIVVDGLPGKRATYRHSFAGESQTFVIVYVPKGNRLYKLSLNYNTGDPNAADFLAAFDAAVASTHFTSKTSAPPFSKGCRGRPLRVGGIARAWHLSHDDGAGDRQLPLGPPL